MCYVFLFLAEYFLFPMQTETFDWANGEEFSNLKEITGLMIFAIPVSFRVPTNSDLLSDDEKGWWVDVQLDRTKGLFLLVTRPAFLGFLPTFESEMDPGD